MSYPNQKNVLHVMVSKGTNVTAATTLVDNYADINDGEIAILDKDNKCLTNAGTNITDLQQFRFVNRVGTNLIYSPWLSNNQIISATATAYSAPTQQVTYLGYVGSGTGNIEALDENEYIVRILIEGTTAQFGNKQMYKFGAYKSSASATSAEVAIGLTDNLYMNFKREPVEQIKFDAICNAAGTELLADTDTVVGYKGSTTLVIGEVGGATIAYAVAAGDFIRIGTAVTDPVYKVISGVLTAADGGTLVLDRPLNADINEAGVGHIEYITAAEGIAAIWGIKVTGVARTNFKVGVFNYEVTRFKLEPQNCGTSAVTYSTAAFEGQGAYGQIAELEYFAQGNLGNKYRIGIPPPTMYANAVSGNTYETIQLKFKDQQGESILGTTPASFIEVMLCFKVDSNDGDSVIAALADLTNVPALSW